MAMKLLNGSDLASVTYTRDITKDMEVSFRAFENYAECILRQDNKIIKLRK